MDFCCVLAKKKTKKRYFWAVEVIIYKYFTYLFVGELYRRKFTSFELFGVPQNSSPEVPPEFS